MVFAKSFLLSGPRDQLKPMRILLSSFKMVIVDFSIADISTHLKGVVSTCCPGLACALSPVYTLLCRLPVAEGGTRSFLPKGLWSLVVCALFLTCGLRCWVGGRGRCPACEGVLSSMVQSARRPRSPLT